MNTNNCVNNCVNNIETKRYDLFFENNKGKMLLIQSNIDPDRAIRCIKNFCQERDFKIPYIRINKFPNGEEQYDVGSHTEFFWVKQAVMKG